ncbi:hypothetical protein DYB35_014020, partial [Aphanomyces astaci]
MTRSRSTSPKDKRTAPKGRRSERLKPNTVTEQEGAETEEEVPTAELAMDPTSGTSTMQPVEDETKEEQLSPKSSERSAPHSMPKSLEGDYIELDNYDDEKTDLVRQQERQQAAKAERKRAKAAKLYRPDGTPDSSYDDESEDERRKANAERRRRNREAKPKNKKVDYVAQAKAEHARRLTAAFDSPVWQPTAQQWTTQPGNSGWTPVSGPHQGGPSLVLKDIEYPPITTVDRDSLVAWKRKRDRYEEKLKANAQRMRHDWRATAVPWLESADRSMVEAACLYLWDINIDDLDESEFRERICKIIGEPANKWTVTKAEMEEQCKKLRVDPFGDVASRVVSFMERVNNIIETTGWKSQLKTPNMLKTFIKVVASCITPFDVRDRVEEQMKTVQASTLVEFSKILAEQLERTYQAELVMKSRGGDRKRGRDWDEKGQRTGKTRVQLKNEQYQREAYYQNGNAPRPKGGYTMPAPVERGRDGPPRAQGATGGPSTNKYGTPATAWRTFDDSEQPTKRAKYGPGQDDRGALCFACQQPGHRARECPNKKEDSARADHLRKGKNAVKRFKYKQRKAELKAKRAVKAKIAEDGCEQRWIRLNGVFEVPYCPDTGADQNVLPQRMLEELMTLQPDLMVVTLKEPMIGMACNNLPFQANAYVDLALQLQTAAGPVKIPGKRRCYVVAEGDEFLASDDTLKAIGIDIDRLLEQVATLQLEDDGDDLEEDGD